MKTLNQFIGFVSTAKTALGLIALAMGLAWGMLAAPALATDYPPSGDQFTQVGGDAVGFRYTEDENGDGLLELGFSCALDTSGKATTGDAQSGLWLYCAGAGWGGPASPPYHERSGDYITWVRIDSEAVDESRSREEAQAAILIRLTFNGDIYDPVLAFRWQWAAIPCEPPYPGAQFHVIGTIEPCWCFCIPEPVADCGSPYVPFSAGPVGGNFHDGSGWGGQTTPPNELFGANASLNFPQLQWSTPDSGTTNIYTFKHGAMQTQAIAGIPDASDEKPFPRILLSNGSALLWTYVAADDEYEFTSKSRARMRFTASGSTGYQKVSRIVAANGVDKLRYKWSGDRPSAIYSNKVGGKRYKTALNYNGDGHISSVNENVVSVSGTWPNESETVLWSRTTTVSYTTKNNKKLISTISHPANLQTTFAYSDSGKLTSVTYPYGHSQHFVYTDGKVTEYYEDGATLKHNRRTYTYNVAPAYSAISPWKVFRTEVTHKKANGTVLSKTYRYHDGWRSRGHSTDILKPTGGSSVARVSASAKIKTGKHSSGGMVYGKKLGSGFDNFFFKSAVTRTEHGSPTKIYARVFSTEDGGDADESESYVRATMDYSTPDTDVTNFETLDKIKTYVGRETHALYWSTGADDSYKYNLQEIWLNDDSSNTITYGYYGTGESKGLLWTVTSFDGTKAEYTYDDRRLLKVYSWPASGTKKKVLEYVYNDGTYSTMPYDAIIGIKDINNKETTFAYDVIGRVTAVTIPADGQGNGAVTWSYAYATWGDSSALKVTVTRPDGKEVIYKYNPGGTLASVDAPDVGAADMVTEFVYDNSGRLVKLIDPADNETLWSYDAAGRVMTETIKGDGGATNVTLYGYNPDGAIAKITDPKGQTFEYNYDDDNRLNQIVMTDDASVLWTKTIAYGWDSDNATELWTVSMSGESVVTKYNEYGLVEYVDGVLSGDDANADKVSYEYDDDYRLEKLKYYIDTGSGLSQVEVAYDYDTFGRLKTIEDRLGLESTYTYNDDFTLKSLTLPNGTVTNYTYDDLRRLVSIATSGLSAGDIITKFTCQYNELGLRDKVTMADGRTTEWDYDDVGRLVQEHFKSAGPSATTLLRYIYTYDAAGNRTSKKTDYDNNDGNGYTATATYTNNAYNQLTAVSGTPGRGNRVNVTGTIPAAWTLAAGDVTVTPNSTPANAIDAEVRGRFFIARNVPLESKADNSIVASTTATTLADHSPSSDTVQSVKLDTSLDVSYTYDANGNLLVKSEEGGSVLWTYTYSVDDWLIKVEGPNNFVEQYTYDPAGRKYKTVTTSDGQTTTRYFVYDGGSILLALDEDKNLDKEFVRGLSLGGGIGGLLYTRDADGSLAYFHYDGQGNVVSVTDEAREELAYYEYDAWGNLLTSCGSHANEFRFSTKQASLGTGLIDFGYRHYDPTVGRWTQRDPIGIAGGLNIYAYLSGNPAGTVDPDGRGPINWLLTGDWNASGEELSDWCEGFASSLTDQWDSMSEAVFGDVVSLVIGAPPPEQDMHELYDKSAWGQSEGTWAEIPTKTSIVIAAAATVGIVVCEIGPPIANFLHLLGNRGFVQLGRRLIEGHHLLPVQANLKAYFARAGLNILKYVIPLERGLHRLKPYGIHCGPNSWNTMWDKFVKANPVPNADKILQHLEKLRNLFGI